MSVINNEAFFVERRKFRRFTLKSLAFAVLRPSMNKIGRIENISKGGLAIEYIPGEKIENKVQEIDIFLHNEKCFIKKVTCKNCYDSLVEPSQSFSKMEIRRSGIAFEDQTLDMQLDIEQFINLAMINSNFDN